MVNIKYFIQMCSDSDILRCNIKEDCYVKIIDIDESGPSVDFNTVLRTTDMLNVHLYQANAQRASWTFNDDTAIGFDNGLEIYKRDYPTSQFILFLKSMLNGKQPDFSILGIDSGERTPEADDIMDPIF